MQTTMAPSLIFIQKDKQSRATLINREKRHPHYLSTELNIEHNSKGMRISIPMQVPMCSCGPLAKRILPRIAEVRLDPCSDGQP